ncbi:unnamed protein product [Discula destructiva]
MMLTWASSQVFYVVDVGLACHGATVGLGTRTKDLSDPLLQIEAIKYLIIWMVVYVVGLMAIKSSICVTLLRIASTITAYRIAIFALLGLTVATFLVTFIGILLYCHPISANWTGQGTCASAQTMVALSYTSTASTILTDLACAVIPAVMLWNTQMSWGNKMSVMVLLSFGSVASVSTMIRAPYIQSYWNPTDNLQYYTGFIVLWSNIESAIGLIACSLPTVRKIFHHKTQTPIYSKRTSLVTFGGTGEPAAARNNAFRNPTDQGISFVSVHGSANHDWTRLQDPDVDILGEGGRGPRKGGIRAEYTYTVEMSPVSETQTSRTAASSGRGSDGRSEA